MKILIVEDDKKIAGAIQRGLKQQSYAADVANDGDSGLSMAQFGSYDLIILDIMLPGSYSGLDIIKELRSDDIGTPILLLTAKDSVVDRAYGLNIGADDYLVKPFAFLELIARVRALLRRPGQDSLKQYSIRGLTIDLDNRLAMYADKEIQLSPREFAMLEYFMTHPDKIVSKQELLEHVWDSDDDVLENTVEAYIAALRKKIDIPLKTDFILTKRGFGYVFKGAHGTS